MLFVCPYASTEISYGPWPALYSLQHLLSTAPF
jgi:hypothetical protein